MKILVLGVTGMLGNALMNALTQTPGALVFGTAREPSAKNFFAPGIAKNIYSRVDASNHDSITELLIQLRPDVIINCIGVVKQLNPEELPAKTVEINSMFPHWLGRLAELYGGRVIHFSTDCVFSGVTGMYKEDDTPDATDFYGRSKLLGEIAGDNITIRTSIIGHELSGNKGLLEWFLSRKESCDGFRNAIFSGFTTDEIARVVQRHIINNADLKGMYHLASKPISKYNLLCLIKETYGKKITINPNDDFFIDRSLDSSRFYRDTEYAPPAWEDMIAEMHRNFANSYGGSHDEQE